MKIAITGHRPNKLNNDYELVSPLINNIRITIAEILHNKKIVPNPKELRLITGMALGIDTLFAKIAIEGDLPFIAVIPFKGQECKWPYKSKLEYYKLLAQASKIFIVDESREAEFKEFQAYKIEILPELISIQMQNRNIWMVDNCDKLIAVWDGTSGGTKNCYDYAVKKIGEENIIRINPKDFKS